MADIVHRIEVAAAPASLYPFVSGGQGFRAWWAEDVVETPDGMTELGFFNRSIVYRLRALGREAGRRAEWRCESGDEWSGTRLVFELEAGASTTVLCFSHAGWARSSEYFESCNTTWGALMYRLKACAEGRTPGPLFLARSLAT